MKQRILQQAAGLVSALMLYSGSTVAVDIPVTITVTIREPVCTVTDTAGNSRTEVNFGTVPVTAVNGSAAIRELNLKVACDSMAPSGKTLKMQVTAGASGTLTQGGTTVLGTSVSGLGIKLTNSAGGVVTPGGWTAVTGVTTPADAPAGTVALKAALVSDRVSTLQAGNFTSSASVVMAYQ
ncbi:fimbrial protein [Salmonella enterica subsp. enterica]|nr:fimbrial protein [Salmonella enterica]ECC3607913.1 fimbrial protein [Salmonella enterica subsp. enterica]EGI6200959.1 fimbrial protein [Salmonella enterica subsp. enterica serovar Eastbourne]ECE0941379.1 fimbrial protein [Salmonella enterica subsp. enterica]ECH9421187.1 fimbrial protein [Salmonella enterica subsp. enterica]